MASDQSLNPHERAPSSLREIYNEYRRLQPAQVDSHPHLIDFRDLGNELPDGIVQERCIPQKSLELAFDRFLGDTSQIKSLHELGDACVYSIRQVPGLQIFPSLFPPSVQIELLSRLLHRDLVDEKHQTNLHLHYNVSYPSQTHDDPDIAPQSEYRPETTIKNQKVSFFQDDPFRLLQPKDPSIHRPLSVQAALNSKLRWMTLGGQYNWTSKEYPQGPPPPFPLDVGTLLRSIFPDTIAEAAIVNLYSPGDTLYPHRDVSEDCDSGLISISLGCDGLFLVGHEDENGCAVIRLRSGDAVYMDGPSRFAWHAVPKVIPSTCPDWLQSWPCRERTNPNAVIKSDEKLQRWQGWMGGKRVNLNVRQMFRPPISTRESQPS